MKETNWTHTCWLYRKKMCEAVKQMESNVQLWHCSWELTLLPCPLVNYAKRAPVQCHGDAHGYILWLKASRLHSPRRSQDRWELTPDCSGLQGGEGFFFLFVFLLMPFAFSLLVFTTRLLLPGTFNSTSFKRFCAHAKCQDAQRLQDAQLCDFDGITLRTRWWNVKEKSSHFHGTPVHLMPKPGAAEHQPALS